MTASGRILLKKEQLQHHQSSTSFKAAVKKTVATFNKKSASKIAPPAKEPKVSTTKTKVNRRGKNHVEEINCYTIKRSLFGMCRSIEMRNVLLNVVRNTSKIMKLAALNIHYTVYEAIEKNNNDTLQAIFGGDKVKVSRYFEEVSELELSQTPSAIRRRIARNLQFTNLMKKLRVKRVVRNRLLTLIEYAMETYLVNMHGSLKCNGERFVKRVFKLFYAQSDAEMDSVAIDRTTEWLFTGSNRKPDDDLLEFLYATMDLKAFPKREMFQALCDKDLWFHHIAGFITLQLA